MSRAIPVLRKHANRILRGRKPRAIEGGVGIKTRLKIKSITQKKHIGDRGTRLLEQQLSEQNKTRRYNAMEFVAKAMQLNAIQTHALHAASQRVAGRAWDNLMDQIKLDTLYSTALLKMELLQYPRSRDSDWVDLMHVYQVHHTPLSSIVSRVKHLKERIERVKKAQRTLYETTPHELLQTMPHSKAHLV